MGGEYVSIWKCFQMGRARLSRGIFGSRMFCGHRDGSLGAGWAGNASPVRD